MKVLLAKRIMTSLDPTVDDPSIQTVWQSDTATATVPGADAIFAHLVGVFGSVPTGGTNALDSYVSAVISRGDHDTRYEFYDITSHLDGSPHGPPVELQTASMISPITSGSLPEGCAATLSFRADYGTDAEFAPHARPRARDRNRFYWGPLTVGTIHNAAGTNRCEFTTQFVTDCLATLHDLKATVTAGGTTWNMKVWSRVNAALKDPTVGFMDTRVDYQRRRSDPSPATRRSITLS